MHFHDHQWSYMITSVRHTPFRSPRKLASAKHRSKSGLALATVVQTSRAAYSKTLFVHSWNDRSMTIYMLRVFLILGETTNSAAPKSVHHTPVRAPDERCLHEYPPVGAKSVAVGDCRHGPRETGWRDWIEASVHAACCRNKWRSWRGVNVPCAKSAIRGNGFFSGVLDRKKVANGTASRIEFVSSKWAIKYLLLILQFISAILQFISNVTYSTNEKEFDDTTVVLLVHWKQWDRGRRWPNRSEVSSLGSTHTKIPTQTVPNMRDELSQLIRYDVSQCISSKKRWNDKRW